MNRKEYLMKLAEQLAISDDWSDKALKVNMAILEFDKKLPTVYARIGKCLEDRGNHIEARKSYKNAVILNPKCQGYRNALDRVEAKLKEAADKKHISEISRYKEAFEVGMAAKEDGDHMLAILALEKSVSYKRSPYALAALAATYRAVGDLERAEAIYREILACSNDSFAKVGLAAVLKDKGRHLEAEGLLSDTLEEEGSNTFALRTMGSVQGKKRNRQESKECF